MLAPLLLVGCQHDPWADDFLTAQPAERDVAGTYKINPDSQKRTVGNSPLSIDASTRIDLSPDHRVEFVHVPADLRDEKVCWVTGRGSWELGKNDNFSVVRATVLNEELNSPCRGNFAYELMLYGKKPPYKLHITIGDPDSGDAVQFEKQR